MFANLCQEQLTQLIVDLIHGLQVPYINQTSNFMFQVFNQFENMSDSETPIHKKYLCLLMKSM